MTSSGKTQRAGGWDNWGWKIYFLGGFSLAYLAPGLGCLKMGLAGTLRLSTSYMLLLYMVCASRAWQLRSQKKYFKKVPHESECSKMTRQKWHTVNPMGHLNIILLQ